MSTIAAIATAQGSGGIAIIRISGPGALEMLKRVFRPLSAKFSTFRPWTLHLGKFVDGNEQALDEGLAVYMPGPNSYTGEDVAEFHCHGGQLLVNTVLGRILELGARPAERGEFTRRAFLNGRMDLTRAEAVAELIGARSPVALRCGLEKLAGHLADRVQKLKSGIDELRALVFAALDFPDDELPALPREQFLAMLETPIASIEDLLRQGARTQPYRTGCRIILAGPVNAGKSSLFNAMAGRKRALVSDRPGTTRDYIEEDLDFNGLPVCVADTAGLRTENGTNDAIEAAGIKRSLELAADADLIWLVLDSAKPEQANSALAMLERKAPQTRILLVWNKADLASPPAMQDRRHCAVSALTGQNLDLLVEKSVQMLAEKLENADYGASPNVRQAQILSQARDELLTLVDSVANDLPYDLCANHLDAAAVLLDEILGLASHDELLNDIFSRFCIGK